MNKILFNHNPEKVIGKFSSSNSMLFMQFNQDSKITIEMLFESYPGAAFKVIEHWEDDEAKVSYVKVAQVMSFSILPLISTEEERQDV
jgi:hypothetical protein